VDQSVDSESSVLTSVEHEELCVGSSETCGSRLLDSCCSILLTLRTLSFFCSSLSFSCLRVTLHCLSVKQHAPKIVKASNVQSLSCKQDGVVLGNCQMYHPKTLEGAGACAHASASNIYPRHDSHHTCWPPVSLNEACRRMTNTHKS
jgi:hypothetical protein